MIDVKQAIIALASNKVDFVLVGGVALSIHSAAYVTYDIDVCFSRARDNLSRLSSALQDFHPRPRGFPENLPFLWEPSTLMNGTLFTLDTDIGDFDLLAEIEGIGGYDDVLQASSQWDLYGFRVNVLTIDGLVKAKERAGRPKDVPGLKILYALRESQLDEE